MSEEKKSIPWGKIIKLFLEFLLAAIVAIFGSCTARSVRSQRVVLPSYFVRSACVKCELSAQAKPEMSVQRVRAHLNP